MADGNRGVHLSAGGVTSEPTRDRTHSHKKRRRLSASAQERAHEEDDYLTRLLASTRWRGVRHRLQQFLDLRDFLSLLSVSRRTRAFIEVEAIRWRREDLTLGSIEGGLRCVNDVDSALFPDVRMYVNEHVLRLPANPKDDDIAGRSVQELRTLSTVSRWNTPNMMRCDCGPGGCSSVASCSCLRSSAVIRDDTITSPYVGTSQRLRLPREETDPPLNECSSQCQCSSPACTNRVTSSTNSDGGFAKKLCVFRHQRKGWCLRAECPIGAGAFVCSYFGELISSSEVESRRRRQKSQQQSTETNYIYELREQSPVTGKVLKTNIDARACGSAARFLSHSCDPNLVAEAVRAEHFVPSIAFFANRDVAKGEELTFDYGGGLSAASSESSRTLCACGSSNCRGFLP